jgi:hypothetical protein
MEMKLIFSGHQAINIKGTAHYEKENNSLPGSCGD